MSALEVMEPSACTWCGIARRGHGRQYADAAGWHEWEQPSQEQVLARMKARRLQLAVARAGAFPVPVGGERTLDVVEEELTGVNLALWEEVQAYARLRLALASAQRGRRDLRARIAELEAQREADHKTWQHDLAAARGEREATAARVAGLEAAQGTVFRASHDSIVMGLYTTADAAREHCEVFLRRESPTAYFGWIEDEEDGVAELVVTVNGEELETGYTVTPLEVASEYDEEADE